MVLRYGSLMTKRTKKFPARTLFANYDPEQIRTAAERAGYQPALVHRWISRDVQFSVWRADEVAIRFGKHPVLVWGESWLED